MNRLLVLSTVASALVAACGGDDGGAGHLADAPPQSDGGALTPVTLTVTNNGARVAGVHVYFVNPDDSPAATVDTDASGVATATVAAGGSVTAVDPFPAPVATLVDRPHDLRTFAGVKPGDQLELTANDATAALFSLRVPSDTSAEAYLLYTTCGTGPISVNANGAGSGSPGGTISIFPCGATADLSVVATRMSEQTQSQQPVAALFHAAASIAGDNTVDLTSDAYADVTPLSFTYTNAPDVTISVQHAPILANGPLGPFAADVRNGVAAIGEPAVAAATSVVDTWMHAGSSLASRRDVVDWGPTTASYMLQLDTALLTDIVDPPRYNPTTRKVSWIEGDPGVTPDLTTLAFDAQRSTPDVSLTWHWTVAAPYAPGEYRLPKLPTDLADWTPTVDDSVSGVKMMNAKVPGGYDAVRPHVVDVWNQLPQPDNTGVLQFSAFVAGASGRVLAVQSPFQLFTERPAATAKASARTN